MKKATNETRIRITIKMPVWGEQTITMSAGAWNQVSSVYSAAARDYQRISCDAIAREYWEIADRIYYVLKARGYYDD